jgi:hypothetical protein
MYTVTDSAAAGTSLFDFPAPAGRVIAGAFDDALETNPVPLFMLSRELNAHRGIGPLVAKDQALEQAKREGVSVKVPDEGISSAALGILIERRKDQAARDLLFARKDGFGASAGMFGAGLAGALMDPVNAASGFIPVLSGTRYAAQLARAGTIASRTGVRAGIGGAEGLVGAGLVEMPTIALRRDLQDDYDLYDSLTNVAFGTFASAGLRTVGGLARDRWRGLAAARQEDFLRSVDQSEWAAARAAHEQQLERSMAQDLEGFERGTGPSDGLVEQWAGARLAAERLAQTDETIGRMRSRMADEEIERFVEAERKMRAEAAVPDDRVLLDSAGIAERKFREMDLAEVRDRLARGEGLIIVPGNEREVAAAISDETHALALKTAVAQAIEGRRIDTDPVVRQDRIFGPQRMSKSAVLERARSNMAPENKVGADRAASQRADESIKVSEGPAAKRGGSEPPPPRGSQRAEAAGPEGKSPELVEAEALLADTQMKLKQAANDAGIEPPPAGKAIEQSEDYERAAKAIAACANRTGA